MACAFLNYQNNFLKDIKVFKSFQVKSFKVLISLKSIVFFSDIESRYSTRFDDSYKMNGPERFFFPHGNSSIHLLLENCGKFFVEMELGLD